MKLPITIDMKLLHSKKSITLSATENSPPPPHPQKNKQTEKQKQSAILKLLRGIAP